MRALTVIPVIDSDLASECVASIFRPDSAAGIHAEDILLVDNTRNGLHTNWGLPVHRDRAGHNIGVARAWNVGARQALAEGYDYLTVMSQSMLFGPAKECTWASEFDAATDVESPPTAVEAFGHSWHLISLRCDLFGSVGFFDENFYPGYFEAIDFGFRMSLLNIQQRGWPRIWCNVLSRTVAAYAHLGQAAPLLAYYREKWGGDKGHETFALPWGDKPMGYYPLRSIPELAAAYELKEWW